MKIALTLLLVGIAQSQTLLNTLRNLGAADHLTTDINNLVHVHTSNIVNLQEKYKCSEEVKKTIFAQADDGIKSIDAKVTEDIKAILAKAVEDKKAINAKATRECNQPKQNLQQLLMQEPKGTQGFIPTKYALNTFKKIGGLNYQKLVDDNIIEEPSQQVTIKLNFKRKTKGYTCYFEFAQVNSDDELHGFARFINKYGYVREAEFRNGQETGFTRFLIFQEFYNKNAYYIEWLQNSSFQGYLNYSIDQDTPISKWSSASLNAKYKEAFDKIKKNGPKSYFTKN